MISTNEIRSVFLDFFNKNGHEIVSSSPLVPQNDPTLLFTNAGMVQFKNVFTGTETRDYTRATTSQKCVRAGGKHNDLDNVGRTARHHTFFEMLGNFSFGDYFKEDAIKFSWDLITKEYGIDKDKLLVTVYHTDDQAAEIWKKVAGFNDDRIIRIPTSDNFWSMGDTGPCGPCSEIFFDHGEHIPGGPPGSPDEDGDRFIEIWNLVFMQFEQMADGSRVELPKPSIDTGMGLERIAAILQGQHDNYDIDALRALIEASANATNSDPDGDHRISHRVIADHLRSSSFLIADGVLPSNEGRGYVLRRIMRRAMRHAQLIGVNEPTMWKLVPALIEKMGAQYAELGRAQSLITETLRLEEERFRRTLERGLRLLDEEKSGLAADAPLPGDVAFKLYDTYGFPLDLTQDALRAEGRTVDTDAFDAAMEEQKAKARANWKGSGEAATDDIWFDVRDKNGATEFLGYDSEQAEGVIQALVKDGAVVDKLSSGDEGILVINQTPFYGESGGQMGDTGLLKMDGADAVVTDTRKVLGDLILHVVSVKSGEFTVDDAVELQVDAKRRAGLRANHSATHLLHAALRDVLGDHVTQKGSLVAEDKLRFDIAHQKAVSGEEMAQVEAMVNARVRINSDVATKLMTPEDAIEEGAMALFGEKYGDEVRVVSMGGAIDNGQNFSVELCGGTHVKATGEIGLVKVVSESAVAAGVRRIEALTGQAALDWLNNQENQLLETAALLKAAPADVTTRVANLLEDRKKLERELAEVKKKLALGGGAAAGGSSDNEAKNVNGINYMGRVLEGVSAKDLRGLIDETKKGLGSGVVAFVAVNDGKGAVAVGVTEDLVGTISAVDLVRAGSAAMGGKGGGGRPDMAQAGGPDGSKGTEAVAAIEAALAG